jgi:hypothetical protein
MTTLTIKELAEVNNLTVAQVCAIEKNNNLLLQEIEDSIQEQGGYIEMDDDAYWAEILK